MLLLFLLVIFICLAFSKGAAPSNRKRQAWSESDDEDEHPSGHPDSSPAGDKGNSAGSDEEPIGDEGAQKNRESGDEEDDG